MKKTAFEFDFLSYNTKYLLTHPWIIFDSIWREVRFAWQRAVRGWDDKAIWSIDVYLSGQIPQLVRRLKEVTHGTPTEMFEEGDWDEEKYEYKEGTLEIAAAKWNGVLDEIAEGFEEYYALSVGYNCSQEAWESEKFLRAFDLLKEHFPSLWD